MTDMLLNEIINKIDTKTVTIADFNNLIVESTPESVRDRLRRRTLKNETDPHIDNPSGHQQLTLPDYNKRIKPKRTPIGNIQKHGRGNIGHDHSVRTQARQRQSHVNESVDFITQHMGIILDKMMIYQVSNQQILKETAIKLKNKTNIDQDWLLSLISLLEQPNASD